MLIENLEASLLVLQKNKEIISVDALKRNMNKNNNNKNINNNSSNNSSIQNNAENVKDENMHGDVDDDSKQEVICNQYNHRFVRGGKDDIDHPINFKRPPLSPHITIYHDDKDYDDGYNNQYDDDDDGGGSNIVVENDDGDGDGDDDDDDDDDEHNHDRTNDEVNFKDVGEHDVDDDEYKLDNYINNNTFYINNNNNNNDDFNFNTTNGNHIINIHDWNVDQVGKQFIDDINDDNVHNFYSINHYQDHHHTDNRHIDVASINKSLLYDNYNKVEKVDMYRTTMVIGNNKDINNALELHSFEVSDSQGIINNDNHNNDSYDNDDDDENGAIDRIKASSNYNSSSQEKYHVWNNTIDVGESFNLVKDFYEVHFDHNYA